MSSADTTFVAEIGQASDIWLFAFVLGLTFAVGLLLVGIDAAVGRHRERRAHRRE